MNVFVSGSIAFDYIMVFPGRFQDHILPDKMHVLSVSFLVDYPGEASEEARARTSHTTWGSWASIRFWLAQSAKISASIAAGWRSMGSIAGWFV